VVCRWLNAALNRFQIREGLKMKIMHLPKQVKMALAMWDTVSLGSEELLQWIKSLKTRASYGKLDSSRFQG
jgi:hypothetical protein